MRGYAVKGKPDKVQLKGIKEMVNNNPKTNLIKPLCKQGPIHYQLLNNKTMTNATYKTAAAAGYSLLVKQYYEPNVFADNFWFGGNSLYTCLRYLNIAKVEDKEKILIKAVEIYKDMAESADWWVDDYGWWGNAFMKAYFNRKPLGYGGDEYNELFEDILESSKFCWRKLKDNWREKPYDANSDHACENSDIVGGTYNTAPDGPGNSMSGRNSVTNEQFWLLSMALNSFGEEYHTWEIKEGQWFNQWTKRKGNSGIINEWGLILERPTGNGTVPEWYWSGDQGLFIMANLRETNMPVPNAISISVANAVVSKMTDSESILHEYMNFENGFGNSYTASYATGKGIFIRNLSELNSRMNERPFDVFIKKNATSVWMNRVDECQFTFNWNPAVEAEPRLLDQNNSGGISYTLCKLIMQTSGLEALTAAMALVPNEPIHNLDNEFKKIIIKS